MVKAILRERTDKEELNITFDLELLTKEGVVRTSRNIARYHSATSTLIKKVDMGKHYFRKYKGYAIPLVLLVRLEDEEECTIKIHEHFKSNLNRIFDCDLDTWIEHGTEIQMENYEKQVVLPTTMMNIVRVENGKPRIKQTTLNL